MIESTFVFLLILLNGVFAMSEIAVISARRARLQQLANKNNFGARIALNLAEKPNQFLATVQVGITLVGILAGAVGSATVAQKLAPLLEPLPFLGSYSEAVSIGLVVLVTTYLSLVVGELVPKRIALLRSEWIAARFAPIMHLISIGASPVVRLLSLSTDFIVDRLGIQESAESQVSEEEIKLMIEEGTQEGVIDPIEEELVQQVFLLGDQTLKDLIVPRTEIVWINLEDSKAEIEEKIAGSRHTRFPVARGNLDDVVGIVLAKDLLIQCVQNQTLNVEAAMYPPLYVPATMPALNILERFQSYHTQIALVVGEYGEMVGLVTINDIVEAMVGDLPESEAEVAFEIVQRLDGSWLVDGLLPLHELKDLLQQETLPGEDEQGYRTLGGFVMNFLGHVPQESDRFEWGGYRFEVVDMDGHRVDKVLIVAQNSSAGVHEQSEDA